MVFSCGPPCRPGNTARSSAGACVAELISIAPRGPRSVLCVVVETTSAWPTGDGCAPPAIRPAMCATSAASTAPTSRAIRGEPGEVDQPRDRGAAAPDQLRPLAQRELADLVEVDRPGVAPDAVAHGPEPLPGHRHAPAVRQVPAGLQRHPQHRVAGLQERGVDREVGGRARERLHVGVLDAEERLGAPRRQPLDAVDDGVALVVAAARVALGVLVDQHRAARGQHRGRRVVLGRDQAQRLELAAPLGGDQLGDLVVMHGQLRSVGRAAQARGVLVGAPLHGGRFHLSASHGTHRGSYRAWVARASSGRRCSSDGAAACGISS